MLHYVLQPRSHQHEGRVAVREGPGDPCPPSGPAVDAIDPVVRTDPVPVFGREFRVGQRLGEPVAHLLAAAPSRIDSSFSAASPAFLPHASRDFRVWIAFNMHVTAFRLGTADLALAMSHVNSEPRSALGFATPARAFRAMLGEDAAALLNAYGVGDVPLGDLDLTPRLIEGVRAERGDVPLA